MDASSLQNSVEQRADVASVSVKRLAPELRAAVENEFTQLSQEHCPIGRAEEVLVREMARHVTALAHAEKAEPSVLAMSAAMVADTKETTGDSGLDAALAASVTSDGTERVSRYRQAHERAFHLALRSLQKLQAARRSQSGRRDFEWDRFSVEEDCEAYLIHWARSRERRCPRCGQSRGDWIGSRGCWECRGCKMQVGMRWGTIFHGSRLPLRAWFCAILLQINFGELETEQLSHRIGITRAATIRKLVSSIREALKSPNSDVLLAGLNRRPSPPDFILSKVSPKTECHGNTWATQTATT